MERILIIDKSIFHNSHIDYHTTIEIKYNEYWKPINPVFDTITLHSLQLKLDKQPLTCIAQFFNTLVAKVDIKPSLPLTGPEALVALPKDALKMILEQCIEHSNNSKLIDILSVDKTDTKSNEKIVLIWQNSVKNEWWTTINKTLIVVTYRPIMQTFKWKANIYNIKRDPFKKHWINEYKTSSREELKQKIKENLTDSYNTHNDTTWP